MATTHTHPDGRTGRCEVCGYDCAAENVPTFITDHGEACPQCARMIRRSQRGFNPTTGWA